jgi:RNA recognition motif-containing protein
MAKKLYVGGLSYDTTEASLKEAFSAAGTVESATIIIDKMTSRSKGFGFVEMATDEEAQKAIETLNGKELDGRSLTVNEARPMEARAPRTGGFNRDNRGGFGGGNKDRW